MSATLTEPPTARTGDLFPGAENAPSEPGVERGSGVVSKPAVTPSDAPQGSDGGRPSPEALLEAGPPPAPVKGRPGRKPGTLTGVPRVGGRFAPAGGGGIAGAPAGGTSSGAEGAPSLPPAPGALALAPEPPKAPAPPWEERDIAPLVGLAFRTAGKVRRCPEAWAVDDPTREYLARSIVAVANKYDLWRRFREEIQLAVGVSVTVYGCLEAERIVKAREKREKEGRTE